ncbi:hypothetical protein [Hyalangium minutum]|uniref:DUF5666 domain-containing protein n=1 Tax=Hyalangium minutum TaxID=394096 RepID=A0A085WVT8_9BACT|nr:hypothetical protein [Hyalangium minutum]KFE71801.1 hypothetical protein DB31_0062 [Hyalangium minutum]
MKKLTGLFAAVALMSPGMALANEGKKHDQQQTQNQSNTGGSGVQTTTGSSPESSLGTGNQMGQSGTTNPLSGNQITGRVVKSDKKMIWVEHAGAIVPLKVDKNTQFTDPSLKRASDFKEGDEIRASFEVRKTDNVATSIQKNTDVGQGGSGSDVMMPDKGINQPSDTLPPSSVPPMNEGLGGSGDLGPDITHQGSDLGTGSDVNQGNKTSGDF